jgi:hypothetical protein
MPHFDEHDSEGSVVTDDALDVDAWSVLDGAKSDDGSSTPPDFVVSSVSC